MLVVPGLSPAQQRLAVLGPGETRLAQDLPEHRAGRLRVGAGQAAQRQRPDRLRPRSPLPGAAMSYWDPTALRSASAPDS